MTGDEREDLTPAGIQYRYIIRAHHLGRENTILILTLQGGELDRIVRTDIPQWPEKRIAVPGERHVAVLARQRRARNVTHRVTQCPVVISFHDHHGEPQALDFKPAQ